MKFALSVFLGLFAISAQAIPTDIAYASLPQTAYNFVSELLGIANSLRKKVQSATMYTLKEITDYVVYKGTQKISSSWAEAEEKLKQFEVGYASVCVKKHFPILKDAKDKLQDQVKDCVQPLVEITEKTKEDLKDTIKFVEATIKEFYIPKKCVGFNPFESARCVGNHMFEFKEMVMNLISDSETKLESAINGTTSLSKQSVACLNDAASDFNKIQKAIMELYKLICKKKEIKVQLIV